jgi:hypothetical protein
VLNEFTLTTAKQPVVGLNVANNNQLVAAIKPHHVASCSLVSSISREKNENSQVELTQLSSEEMTGISSDGGKYFAVGYVGSTRLYETNSLQEASVLQSHSTLGAKHLQILQDQYVLTSSHDDRYINMYDITKETKDAIRKPQSVISVESNVVTTDVTIHQSTIHLLVVTQNGNLYMYDINPKKKTHKPSFVVKSADNSTSGGLGSILTAKFDQNDLVIASGSRLTPFFTRVSYISQGEILLKGDIMLSSIAAQNKPQKKENGTTNQVKAKLAQFQSPTLKRNGVSVLGPSNMEAPGARYRQAFSQLLGRVNKTDTNDNVLSSMIPDQDETTVPKIKITTTIVQALQSNDRVTIYKCLDQTDVDLVQATVRELPAHLAISLLEILIERLQDDEAVETDGNMTSTLVAWIRAILLIHTSHIISQRKIIDKLSPLYQSISHRLTNFTALLELSGRLDLLLSLAGYAQVGLSASRDDFKDDFKRSEEEERTKLRTYQVTEEEDEEDIQYVHGGKGRDLNEMGYQVMGDDEEERQDAQEEAIEKRQGWFLDNDGDIDSEEEDLIRQLDEEEKRLGIDRSSKEEIDDDDEDEDVDQDEDFEGQDDDQDEEMM